MLHDHIDVLSRETLFRDRGSVILSNLFQVLLCSSLLGDVLGLGLRETIANLLEWVFIEEDNEGVSIAGSLEDLGILDDKNVTVAFSKGNPGDFFELLHAKLEEGLAAFLLSIVELFVFSILMVFWYLILVLVFMVVSTMLVVDLVSHLEFFL